MYHYIGWVALIGTFLTGILIIVAMPELLRSGYVHVKLTVVVILAAFHLDLGRYMVQLREKRCNKSGMFFRAYNEVPTIAMVIIIWMMVYKPVLNAINMRFEVERTLFASVSQSKFISSIKFKLAVFELQIS